MAKASNSKRGNQTVTTTTPAETPAAPAPTPAPLDENGGKWLVHIQGVNAAGQYAMIGKDVADALAGYVDVNFATPDASGNFPAILTDLGTATLAAMQAPAPAPVPAAPAPVPAPVPAPAPAPVASAPAAPQPAPAPQTREPVAVVPPGGFDFVMGLTPPAAAGGGRGKRSNLPLDQMPLGAAIFVPVTGENTLAKLMKSVSAIASTATDRSKKNTPNDPKFFACRKFVDGKAAGFGDKWAGVQGVGVYRVAANSAGQTTA